MPRSRAAADRKARAIVDDLRAAKMNTAADLVERSVSETLTYYAFPDIHWQKICITDEIDKNFFCEPGDFAEIAHRSILLFSRAGAVLPSQPSISPPPSSPMGAFA